MTNQIEEYEHPYQVVYGADGEPPKLVPGEGGTDWPIYKARRMVVALLTAQVEKLPEDDPEAVELRKIRQAFQNASTGEVVWGMVKFWKNKKGRKRFIGLVEKGRGIDDAGQSPNKGGFVPSHHPTKSLDDNDYLRHGALRDGQFVRQPPMSTRGDPAKLREIANRDSEAARIADRMAKAARKAVEGEDDNTAP